MLRQHKKCANQHTVGRTCRNSVALSSVLAFACSVVVAVAAPAVPAAPGDPKQASPPQELWEAFPLGPNVQRLVPERDQRAAQALFTPPGRTQIAALTPPDTSSNDLPLVALAVGGGTLILLSLFGLVAVRLRDVAGHRRRSVPLLQGAAEVEASRVSRLQRHADVDVLLPRPSRVAAGEVVRIGARQQPRRPYAPRDLRAMAHSMRSALRHETVVSVLLGSAIAIVAAVIFIHLVG